MSGVPAELFRSDGSPKNIRIKRTPYGPAYVVVGKGMDTVVRAGHREHHDAYATAVEKVMVMHNTNDTALRLMLFAAMSPLHKRYAVRIKTIRVLELPNT